MKKKLDPALIPVIGLAVLSFIFIIITLYNVYRINSDRAELATGQEALAVNIQRRDYLRNLAANKDMVENKIRDFTAMLPKKVMQDDIFLKVNKLGGRYDVTVSRLAFSSSATEPGTKAEKLEFSMSMEGGYENIMKMLEDLAGVDKFTHVKYILLDGKGTAKGIIKAQASVDVYYYPEDNPQG